ncbi:MAG: GAF domain-containing protein [Phycisphaerales bacterium]|nr:GAF domain-containing protein [Phycisphaerales bacterium]
MPTARRDYESIAATLDATGDRDVRMARLVDVLWSALAPTGVSWLGFYLDRPDQPDERRLELGPRAPKPACSPIGLHGACGQALLAGEPMVIRDVAELGPNYIACDPRDRSELVLPLRDAEGRRWAVLDLDSHEIGAFAERDVSGLELVLRAAGLCV